MAGFATIAGVIVLAFPITMIVENFCRHYQIGVANAAAKEAHNKARRESAAAKRKKVKSPSIFSVDGSINTKG